MEAGQRNRIPAGSTNVSSWPSCRLVRLHRAKLDWALSPALATASWAPVKESNYGALFSKVLGDGFESCSRRIDAEKPLYNAPVKMPFNGTMRPLVFLINNQNVSAKVKHEEILHVQPDPALTTTKRSSINRRRDATHATDKMVPCNVLHILVQTSYEQLTSLFQHFVSLGSQMKPTDFFPTPDSAQR